MTNDQHILRLLEAGELRVDVQTGRVWYPHPYRSLRPNKPWVWVEKKASYCPHKDRWRFHFTFKGKSTTVSRSRLIYLAKTHTSVEVVDHLDGNRTNYSVDNLGPHARQESDRQGREAQRLAIVKDAEDFFDYIAFWGCEPPGYTYSKTGYQSDCRDDHDGYDDDPEHLNDPGWDADAELS